MYTTNYFNAFILVSDDCTAIIAEVPPQKKVQTAATITYELLKNNPYKHTSDEVLFNTHVLKNGIATNDVVAERERFFSKSQPCFRSSPLCKRYGWGVHSNPEGKIAIYAIESDEYKRMSIDSAMKIIKAIRSKSA